MGVIIMRNSRVESAQASVLLLVAVSGLVGAGVAVAVFVSDPLERFSKTDACSAHEDDMHEMDSTESSAMTHEKECMPLMGHAAAMAPAEPKIAYELEQTFASADRDGFSFEEAFLVEEVYETLEVKLSYSGIGTLHVQVLAPDGSVFYECNATVSTLPTDHEMEPDLVEKAKPGDYTIKIGVTGQVTVSLAAIQHPPGHAPSGMRH